MSRSARRRRNSARIVAGCWIAAAAGVAFSFFHTDDRDPLQMLSAVFACCAIFYAFIMSLAHWVVLLPMLNERERRSRPEG